MPLAETLFVTCMLYAVPGRSIRSGRDHHFFSNCINTSFGVASGISLEEKVKTKFEDLPGVALVSVRQETSSIKVDLCLEALSFEIYEKVALRKLGLFDEYPDMDFEFSVSLCSDFTQEHVAA